MYTQGSDAFRSVTAGYATSDTLLNADGSTDIVPAIRSLFDVNMRLLIAAILGMSGVSYILRASVLRSAYERRLQHEHSLLRWVEYAGGLGFVAVALVVGVSDIASLISILLATAVAIRGWRSLESSNHGSSKINWSGMKVMVESTAIPGVLIAVALYAQNRYASLDISPQTWRAVAIVAIASVAQALAVRAYYTRPPAKRVYHNVEWTRMFIAFVTIAAVSVSIYGHLLAS